MQWKTWVFGILVLASASVAYADEIPRDRSHFVEYLTSRLQTYTRERLTSLPDSQGIVIGNTGQEIPTDSIFYICHTPKIDCEGSVDKFVQQSVEVYLQLPTPDPATMRAGLFLQTRRGEDLDDSSNEGGPVSKTLDGMLTERCFIDPLRQRHELRFLMLNHISLDADAAINACENNLRAAIGPLPDVYRQLGADRIGMVKGSTSESARMILLDQWRQLQLILGGHLIAAAPTLDIVVYSNSDDPAAIEALKERAKQIMLSSGDPLEYDIYEFDGRRWNQLTNEEHGKDTWIVSPH